MLKSTFLSLKSLAQDPSDGALLALLTGVFYVGFTLLPGSSTMMVLWPWVFLWQIALMLPMLWLLWQVWKKPLRCFGLGHGCDWLMALTILGLGISTSLAEFPQQARWYAWAALGAIAAIYALSGWLKDAARSLTVLKFQGYLALAFIVLSLGLWVTQIYLPELARLSTLSSYGVDTSFSFQFTSLRNWQPIGHQNYVAGYLVLVLPLLAGLAWLDQSWQRWLWGAGLTLGLVDLYTTSSRGGWLALLATGIIAIAVALLFSRLPRQWVLAIGAGAMGVVFIAILSNNRLRTVLSQLARGNFSGGELSYRVVTNLVGWNMGLSRPFTGLGPGSVPLVYQHYRPGLAGREAELQFQLHSTPAQLWGEVGIWGVVLPGALVVLLGILIVKWVRQDPHHTPSGLPPILVWAMLAGLLAFGLLSLTDYQLDIVGISGVLCIYLAVLARTFQPIEASVEASVAPRPINRILAGGGMGLVLAMALWLAPVHRAWALSNSGFAALADGNLNAFAQSLTRAHNLAPWEPYYPFQLGWNLGDLSYQVGNQNPELRQVLLTDAIAWFETGNQVVPFYEFGHSNLGWLLLDNQQPELAIQSFTRSIELVPAKQGVLFGLGFSCLQAGDIDCAVDAFALEIIRHPTLLSSPIWRFQQFSPIYPQVVNRVDQIYSELLASEPELTTFLHRARGNLRWWTGDLAGAAQDWETGSNDPIYKALLTLAKGETVEDAAELPASPMKYAILAWQTPDQRQARLEQAWVTQPEDLPQLDDTLPPAEVINELVTTMDTATSFDDWLKRTAPSWQPRSERLGFGVLSRHIDGPIPVDFYPRIENVPIAQFFTDVFVSSPYMPPLDIALQPYREALLIQDKS
jgi:tetratricopeptide (TPR) repeat protein